MAQAQLVEFDCAVGISDSTLYVDDPCAKENDSEDYSAEDMQGWQGIDGAEPEIYTVTNEVNDWDNGPCEILEPQHTLACDSGCELLHTSACNLGPLPLETKVEATRAIVQPTGETAHCGFRASWNANRVQWDNQHQQWDDQCQQWDTQCKQWDTQCKQWDTQCKQWDNSHPVIEPNLIQLPIPQPENLEPGKIVIDIEEGEIC
ncbi:hypothetical protein BDR04DRAFT_1123240 [Suillus decipiens]|nr:hypothetical protein BDR04DRAFT_1123240 [Suillus decipiens]